MELNYVVDDIELLGTTVCELNVENSIVDVEKDSKRNFGMCINEPKFQKSEAGLFGQLRIDFEVEIHQSEEKTCKIQLSLEGAFGSEKEIADSQFEELVLVNGAAALIGIARGKIEVISANIFNNGKIVIPFVNVIEYYKEHNE